MRRRRWRARRRPAWERPRGGAPSSASWIVAVGAVVVVLSGTLVQTAANPVTAPRLDQMTQATTASILKPSACSATAVTTLLRDTGTVTGTGSAELILAGTGIDTIDGGAGNDCILGGAGADVINGGTGTDVCIGGPGADVFTSCETQIQ